MNYCAKLDLDIVLLLTCRALDCFLHKGCLGRFNDVSVALQDHGAVSEPDARRRHLNRRRQVCAAIQTRDEGKITCRGSLSDGSVEESFGIYERLCLGVELTEMAKAALALMSQSLSRSS